mmetsp:Transcript_43808/g.135348  ORF Transcript_43808/g.135348 Transcript_43808/m.135348 type:complete len:272 (+) Transcript_43808:562-1377(+)
MQQPARLADLDAARRLREGGLPLRDQGLRLRQRRRRRLPGPGAAPGPQRRGAPAGHRRALGGGRGAVLPQALPEQQLGGVRAVHAAGLRALRQPALPRLPAGQAEPQRDGGGARGPGREVAGDPHVPGRLRDVEAHLRLQQRPAQVPAALQRHVGRRHGPLGGGAGAGAGRQSRALGGRRCSTCNLVQPRGCSHCEFCQVCVEGFDHHCPWMGKCIGRNNLCAFYTFIAVSMSSLAYIFLLTVMTPETGGTTSRAMPLRSVAPFTATVAPS